MNLTPLLEAPAVVAVHAMAALLALVVGLLQLALPKGNSRHRIFGYAWVAIMIVTALTSFWIHEIDQWNGFSWIHLLSIVVLISLPPAVMAARGGRVQAHRNAMVSLFIGGLVVAGLFTLLPGRLMSRVFL